MSSFAARPSGRPIWPRAAAATSDESAGRSLATAVSRQRRLLPWFDLDVPLLILHGPPGSGKSESIAHWLRADPAQNVTYVTFPLSGEQFAHVLRNSPSRPDATRTPVVIDEVDNRLPDDIEQMLFAAIRDRPDRRFLVSGRRTSDLEERAYRARVKSATRFGEELMATVSELNELATVWNSPLDAERIREVHEITNGWLEPARLILRDSKPGSLAIDAAQRWLKSIAFDDIADDELTLLDYMSVIHHGDTETLDLIVSRHDWDAPIVTLHERGLVRREREGGWTIASPLVRSVVNQRVRARSSAETAALHTKIATIAYACDPMRFARQILNHARLGKAWKLLERFWTEHGSAALAELPHETNAAFTGVPDHVVNRSATLTVAAAFSTATASDDGVLERLARYSFQHTPTAAHLPRDDTTDAFVEATVIRILQLRGSGRLAEANSLSETAEREVGRRVMNGARHPNAANSALLLIQQAINRMLIDNGGAPAAELASRALDYARASKHTSLTSSVLGYLAVLRAANGWSRPPLTWGTGRRPDVARDIAVFDSGHAIARAMISVDALDRERSLIAQDRADSQTDARDLWPLAALAQNRHFLFFEAAEDLDDYHRHLKWTYPSASDQPNTGRMILEWSGVLADLRAGRLSEAERRVAEAQDESSWMSVLIARLHLSKLDYEAVLTEVASAITDDTIGNRERSQLLFMAAASSLRLGKEQQAASDFHHARSLADAHTLRSTYLAISREHRAELLELTHETLPRETAARLDDLPDAFPEGAPPIVLSNREWQILHGMAMGASHRETATALYISVPTVRSHIRTLYAKLDVNNSARALGRAAELGLLLTTDLGWDGIRAMHGGAPIRP